MTATAQPDIMSNMKLNRTHVHFTTGEPQVFGLTDDDLSKLRQTIGLRDDVRHASVTVEDFNWSPINPKQVTINARLVKFVEVMP